MNDKSRSTQIVHVLFLDIVGYSRETTSVQSRLIAALNAAVAASPAYEEEWQAQAVQPLPTGDGMALLFWADVIAPSRCAVDVSRSLHTAGAAHNVGVKVRMGIHSGLVQKQMDIAGRENVVGEGINTAQRVMDFGEAGHILLSAQYAMWLQHFDEWVGLAHPLGEGAAKHGQKVQLYSLHGRDFGNTAAPSRLAAHGAGALGAKAKSMAGMPSVVAPDSHTLLSGSLDRTVKIWDIAHVVRPAFAAEVGVVASIAYSRDGSRLLTSGARASSNFAHVWDAHTHTLVCTTPAHADGVMAAFSPDGRRLVLAGEDKTLTLCDANTGGVTARFEGVQEPLTTAAWSPDGKWIATGGRGAGFHPRLWDAVTHKESAAFARQQGHLGWVLSLAFSPDSHMLVSGGGNGELRWWDTVTQKEISPPPRQVGGQTVTSDFAHRQNIFALAFSPDGRYLVTGSEDNTARLWDTRSRQPIHLMPGHTDIVYAAAFSPDGRTLVTGGKDGTIKMWALSTLRDNILQDTVTLRGDREGVSSLAFSPDGATLAVGHKSGVVVLWQGERSSSETRLAGRNSTL